jgi:chemotaxis signal transduction protein
MAEGTAVNETRTYCTFMMDGHCYGVPVQRVQEVLRHNEITQVSLAPREVCGLINLRGQIVTVIDLRSRLSLSPREPTQTAVHVIVERDGEAVSLLVDALGDVRQVEKKQFELPPDTLKGVTRDLIVGTYKTERELLIVLDVQKISDIHAGAEPK